MLSKVKAMSNLKTEHADLWQTLLNMRNVNRDSLPESQGFLVLPDSTRGPQKFCGILDDNRKPRVTDPKVAHNDISSIDDDDEEEEDEVPVNAGRIWSAKDKLRMVRMRAGKVTFTVIAKRLGGNSSACQGMFCKIRDQPEYKAILGASCAYDVSDDDDEKVGRRRARRISAG